MQKKDFGKLEEKEINNVKPCVLFELLVMMQTLALGEILASRKCAVN